jgi:hypothetical protein
LADVQDGDSVESGGVALRCRRTETDVIVVPLCCEVAAFSGALLRGTGGRGKGAGGMPMPMLVGRGIVNVSVQYGTCKRKYDIYVNKYEYKCANILPCIPYIFHIYSIYIPSIFHLMRFSDESQTANACVWCAGAYSMRVITLRG